MKLPAIRNATLTRVQGQGFTADAELPATAGGEKWAGEEEAFFSEITERVEPGGSTDVVVRRSLVVDAALAVDFAIGDTLTIDYQGNLRTAAVRRVGRTTAPRLAGVTRLVLEDG